VNLVKWIETNKDFFLAIGALLAPFAAVLIGFVASKRQAVTLLESTRMQIRASALRDYRQRGVEKLREEIAAQIFYMEQLPSKHQEFGLDDPKVRELIKDAAARRVRIRVLSAVSREQLEICFAYEDGVLDSIRSKPARKSWEDEETLKFYGQVAWLENSYLKVWDSEMHAAAEPS